MISLEMSKHKKPNKTPSGEIENKKSQEANKYFEKKLMDIYLIQEKRRKI